MRYVYYGNELYHHGILGQKWGVRRYQNYDGSLTSAGKQRYSSSGQGTSEQSNATRSSSNVKKAAVATAITAITVTAAAIYVHNHPEAIGKVVSKFKDVKVGEISQAAAKKGKDYVASALKATKDSVKEGVKEGIKEAPKKAAKAVVTGVVLNQTKRMLDSAVGKEESARIFQANDNKKIGKFWRVLPEDKDDDEDS